MHERKVFLNFLVVSCKSAFKGILGRSFLVKLDTLASPTYLKVTYQDEEWRSVIINVDLEEVGWILACIWGNILALIPEVEDEQMYTTTLYLDAREEEVRPTQTESLNPSISAIKLRGQRR